MNRREHLLEIVIFLGKMVAVIPAFILMFTGLILAVFFVLLPSVFIFGLPKILVLLAPHPVGVVAPATGDRMYAWADNAILEDGPLDRIVDLAFDVVSWPLDKVFGMKLVASMVVHDELDRYLLPCLEQLRQFCDEIRVLDDASTDDTAGVLGRIDGVEVKTRPGRGFFDHEGRVRQELLDWTLEGEPTHVLAIDADELILEGMKLREQLSQGYAWSLCMREVWKATPQHLQIRQDGGWCEHEVTIAWRMPQRRGRSAWRIANRALACGRVPTPVLTVPHAYSDVAIYHFGWANQPERAERHRRYVEHDGGRFHAGRHINSIMWPDMDVTSTLETVEVPESWVSRANRDAVKLTNSQLGGVLMGMPILRALVRKSRNRTCSRYGHLLDEWTISRVLAYTDGHDVQVRCERCGGWYLVREKNNPDTGLDRPRRVA